MLMTSFLTIHWLASLHLAQVQSTNTAPDAKPPDALCQLLFDHYVRGVKVNGSDRKAAYDLIASRGRNYGFANVVLDEWRKGDPSVALQCVKIIGRMLETDAWARVALEAQRKGEYHGAWAPSISLDDGVVPELIDRAKRADRHEMSTYLIAIGRARDARAKELFEETLRKREKASYQLSDQFHAAVGLAAFGDPVGVEWLIEHVDDKEGDVSNAWPDRVPDIKISSCCRAVLRDVSELPAHTTKDQWKTWFRKQQGKFEGINRIRLGERI